jgi:hypothetical protein
MSYPLLVKSGPDGAEIAQFFGFRYQVFRRWRIWAAAGQKNGRSNRNRNFGLVLS